MPKNVTASCGDNSANIAWEAVNSPDVIGYNVYERLSPNGDFQLMNGAPMIGTTYVVQGLSSYTAYDFGVKTVHVGGALSGMSNLATCTTN